MNEQLGSDETKTLTREEATGVLSQSYRPEGVERLLNLPKDRLIEEKGWLQRGLDDLKQRVDSGQTEGLFGGRNVSYGEVISEIEKDLPAIDALIESAKE